VLAEPADRPVTSLVAPVPGRGWSAGGTVSGRPAQQATVAATAGATSRTVQAHYAAPARDTAGRIDVERTLDAIIERGSTVYSYLLYSRAGYNSARDWQTLPEFLSAARVRGVRVQVTLTPPASTSNNAHPCSADQLLPYRGRYDAWMAQIGALARQHPNLTAVVMDDYGYSATNHRGARCRTFAPGTITRWRGILRGAAGRDVQVMPVLYLHDMVGAGAIYPSIRREAPAVVWPYVSIGEGVMRQHYRAIRNASTPKPMLHVMVYAAPFRDRVPTESTVRQEVAMAKRLGAAGVVLYQQPLY
jgi:hypothetical protein